MKETFYAQLQKMLDSCPEGDTFIVLDNLVAKIGTDKDDYESFVGPFILDQNIEADLCS